jgi:hypothetical protein
LNPQESLILSLCRSFALLPLLPLLLLLLLLLLLVAGE